MPLAAVAQAPAGPQREGHLKSVDMVSPLILVVEDDPSNARLIRAHLESDGYQVTLAATSKEALDITELQRPQAVLLDLILLNGEDPRRLRRVPHEAPGARRPGRGPATLRGLTAADWLRFESTAKRLSYAVAPA